MASIYPHDWEWIFLKQDPFPNTPPRCPEDAVWTGFQEVKEQVNELFVEALALPQTQVVLARGEYGSGKTHAAMYTRRRDYLDGFVKIQRIKDIDMYYVQLPKEPEHADELLYRDILEAVQFRRLRQFMRAIVAAETPHGALEKLQNLSRSETMGRALWLLGFDPEYIEQKDALQENNMLSEQQKLLERYFFSQATKRELKQLGLSRDIKSTQDRFHILASVFQCISGLAPIEAIEQHRRVILWIDEMEDLIGYPSRYHRSFLRGLRDLIDMLPNYFTIFMNFSLASFDYAKGIEVVTGADFLDRITHQIYFKEPNEEEAFEYVKDLFSYYRTENPEQRGLSAIYPFDKEALCTLIANLHSRTPRDINQRCADVITAAFQRGVITAPGNGIIDKDFVRSVEDRRIGPYLV
jgi:hypothetical protein